jgi:aminopeptidase N
VGLYDDEAGKLVRRRRVELDVVGRETDVPELAGEALAALGLLNDGDLTYAKIRLDDASFATLTRRLRDLADSMPRALCWAATWDMVRDAELPTRDYVRLVLGNVDGETQVAIVETLLGQAGTAAHFYGDPANHDAALESLATAAWEHLRAAAPGSDHQLAWARAFAGFARSAQHLAAVRGLLDATVTFEGLAIDTELRWTFVRNLAARGAADEGLIEEELRRDATDAGARHAAAARAAMPTAAAKAVAWEQILDPSVTFAMMRALMGGFQQPDQEALLEPYAAKYFEQIGPMFETRSLEVAIGFTSGMYPRMLVREDIVAMTDEYIATFNPPGPAHRLLLEGKDAIERALRARACDIAAGR